MTQIFERIEGTPVEHEYTPIQLKIFRDRYALGEEQFPHEAWQRVASAVAAHELPGRRDHWTQRFFDLMANFRYVPGGRIMAAMGSGAGVTAQNCYVIPSPDDSRAGIMHSLGEWVEIQSKGGGVGVNISSLRPRGELVKGVNGTSSGPVSWAQLFAFVSHDIIIQGGSRRGAAMIMLDVDHPDIFEFIHAKETPGILEGCNISVCLSDSFMEAVERDTDWDLVWKGKVIRTVRARQIWDEICEAAWKSAEPGIYFMERANKEANSGYFETLISTNPCGEQPLGAFGACLLGSFNLAAFVKHGADGAYFDFDEFAKFIPSAVRFNDNVVDLSNYPLPECRDSQERIRRMGIGVMGIADVLLHLKLRYGSPEAIEMTGRIYETLRNESYRASVRLAEERGAFPEFIADKYLERPFIKRLPEDIRDGIRQHGIRNCYMLTQAPTGTTSLLAGVNSGIEPYFDFDYLRSDRTGDYSVTSTWADLYGSPDRPEWLVAANDILPEEHVFMQAAAQRFNDSSISKTVNAPESHTVEDVRRIYLLAYHEGLKSTSYYRDNSRSVQVLYHKKEESAPTAEEAIAAAQALLASKQFVGPTRRKLGDERQAITHKFRVGEQEGYMTVGLFDDGTPGEIFINVNKQGSTVSGLMDTVAMLTSYALQYGVPLSELVSKLKNSRFEPSGPTGNPNIPIATSIIDYVFRWLELKFEGATAGAQPTLIPAELVVPSTSGDALKYASAVSSGVGCPECGEVLFVAEGCLSCRHCGYTKCG